MKRVNIMSDHFNQTVKHLYGKTKSVAPQPTYQKKTNVKPAQAKAGEKVQTPHDHKKPSKKGLKPEQDCC
jgi:hypothetical protein